MVDEGEPGGSIVYVQCERCAKREQHGKRRAYWQGVERVQRNAAKGYGLDPDKAFDGIKYDAERS